MGLRNSKVASIPARLAFIGGRRLDGETYLGDGFQCRYRIRQFDRVDFVGNVAKVWQPARLKGVCVDPTVGIPFLAATQVFDIHPMPRKWLSSAHTPSLESRYLTPGTILVTCSGNVGDALIAYRALEKKIVSHDLLRVDAHDRSLTGYLYIYFRTRHGRAIMQSSQYGNIIKHMEPEHLNAVPVPRFESTLEAELDSDVLDIFGWREEAFKLETDAEQVFAKAIGIRISATMDDVSSVPAIELFSRRRRLDGYHYNAVARELASSINRSSELGELAADVILPDRFTRRFMEGGLPFIGSEHIFKLNPPVTKFLSPGSMSDSSDYFVEPDWILMARSGQLYGTNGNVALSDTWHAEKVLSEDIIRVVPKNVRPGFLRAALGHPTLGQPLVLREAFGTSIPHIDPGDIRRIRVPRLAAKIEDEIAENMETANAMRKKAREKEDSAVAKLEKRIDKELVESAEGGPVKVTLLFDEAIRRALKATPPAEGWGTNS